MTTEEILSQITSYSSVIIYGAQMVAVSTYFVLKEVYRIQVPLFCVSSHEGNPTEIDGHRVMTIEELVSDNNDSLLKMPILIATPENYHVTIQRSLVAAGFENIVCVDSGLENALLNTFYKEQEWKVLPNSYELYHVNRKRVTAKQIQIFMAKCHTDKPLRKADEVVNQLGIIASNSDCLVHIQVGCDLTDIQLANVEAFDNVGDNISIKNSNYSELTATYWAWKHADSAYVGICHYRRLFVLNQEQLQFAIKENVDAILIYPSMHYPSIEEHYKRYLNEIDWLACRQAIREVAPEYDAAFNEVFADRYLYNYNMVIARKNIFDDYCKFLFPVLQRVEELTTPKGWERADRFAGYLGENLTTLYFRKNKDKLNIMHTGKVWLI